MKVHNLKINTRILDESMYKFKDSAPDSLLLTDPILAYYNGINWKIIDLGIVKSYPIIYDEYTETVNKNETKTKKITLAVCPITLIACMFEGVYTSADYLIDNSMVLLDDKKNHFKLTDHTNNIKRWGVEIKIFRNAISEHTDAQYMHLSNKKPMLMPSKYYEDNTILYNNNNEVFKFHPKTLVYVIQYRSDKSQTEKTTIILGHNAKLHEATGYNIVESGIEEYIESMAHKIIDKSGFIIPMLWLAHRYEFPGAKIICL